MTAATGGECQPRRRACFEFIAKLGIDYYCFHDRDVAPELATSKQSNDALDEVADHLGKLQKQTGIKLLWGTACLFAHPRYMQGAATSAECRCLRLRRRAGEEGHGCHQAARRRRLHLLGRPRRLSDAARTPT